VLCRGCDAEKSTWALTDSSLPQCDATTVEHQGSLLKDVVGVGAGGRPCPREQDGPEHGTSCRGPEGDDWDGPVTEDASNPRSDVAPRVDRIRFEVTP